MASVAEHPPVHAATDSGSRRYTASQWRLMWWKFRKHKVAMVSGMLLIVLYLIALFCEFLSPQTPEFRSPDFVLAPPQRLHFVDADGVHLRPFVYALEAKRNPQTLRLHYQEDAGRRYPIRFFVHRQTYRLWGLFQTDLHLIGTGSDQPLYLLGADFMGRDLLSRILHGARISLTVGLLGVGMSFVLGLFIGGASGFWGGWVDNAIQRVIEILRSIPTIPLWMALSAALPATWPPLRTYFGITLVLSLLGWTGLAREVRGKILSLREEDFAMAAILAGASRWRVLWRHLLPSFLSHITVSLTLAIPGMIIGETALSFLGLGLRPPVISWGVLLQDAQNFQAVAMTPWLLAPALLVILTVLAFNFVGDGLRDAADPYAR